MNAFVRQIAVLSVLWSLCEMLLPDGKYQQMVRMTASLLVMTALLTTLGGWLGNIHPPAQAAMTVKLHQTAKETYQRTALTAMANQLESYCVHMAQRAGYQAGAVVCLTVDGQLDHVELMLKKQNAALLPSRELTAVLADQLGVEQERIRLSVEEE